ncbi:hypothetical protein V1460_21605 [Streptomyces sp. SCSIO 30461]|uniref:hypothetical protein n=1 Tax=Streptomyces sp. SCSIO 30461 TaxID=3118085 RepID=UPI0030CCC970
MNRLTPLPWDPVPGLLPARGLASTQPIPPRDPQAGLVLVALPFALDFRQSPGFGAEAGGATAVLAGALAEPFGSSDLQAAGPVGAMTAALAPTVPKYGPGGATPLGQPRRVNPGSQLSRVRTGFQMVNGNP